MTGSAHAVPVCHRAAVEIFWPCAIGRAANLTIRTPSTGRILESEALFKLKPAGKGALWSVRMNPPEGWHVAADHVLARLRYWLRLIDVRIPWSHLPVQAYLSSVLMHRCDNWHGRSSDSLANGSVDHSTQYNRMVFS
jgi:hypothetical protein